MTRLALIHILIEMLLNDMPEFRSQAARVDGDASSQRLLLRSLMNLRPPAPLTEEFLDLQDQLLLAEREERGVVDASALLTAAGGQTALWRGDMTQLAADAIVNAANSSLLGCFHPCHRCIDNAIHSAAGLQLREECHQIMQRQRRAEPAGKAKITKAYNLPSRHVIHTVGPIIQGEPSENDCALLASCYRACLELAEANKLRSIAFCCISTGEFHFPREAAARIAVDTVNRYRQTNNSPIEVIFDVFQTSDEEIYRRLLPTG